MIRLSEIDGGMIKTWLQRLQSYTGIYSLMILFYLFIVNNDWLLWYEWLLLLVISSSCILITDVRKIYPQSIDYQNRKNKKFMEMYNKVNKLYDLFYGEEDDKKKRS